MNDESRHLARQAARHHLEAAAPEELATFDQVFDFTYASVCARIEDVEAETETHDASALPFTSLFTEPTVVAATIVAAALLVRAYVEARRTADPLEVMKDMAARLIEQRQDLHRMSFLVEKLVAQRDALARLRAARLAPDPAEGDAAPALRIYVDEELQEGRPLLIFGFRPRDSTLAEAFQDLASAPLRCDLQAYVAELFRAAEALLRHGERDAAMAQQRLQAVGKELSLDLLPAPLQQALWSHREDLETVQIVSGVAAIPWELGWLDGPGASAPTTAAGRFFATAFNLSRWFEGELYEALHLPLRRVALIVSKRLQGAREERRMLRQTLKGAGCEVDEVKARWEEVMTALGAGIYDGVHFAGHASARGSAGGLRLDDGTTLQPRDVRALDFDPAERRPLVLLNGCATTRGHNGPTGIAGLARSFQQRGAGAVIGTQWAVADEVAADFAQHFYHHFLAGHPLGQAMKEARLALHAQRPGDPGWLAYTLFGHPAARRGRAA